jgi:hypothetical protein
MWAVQFDDDIDIDDKEECGSVPMTVEKVNLMFQGIGPVHISYCLS